MHFFFREKAKRKTRAEHLDNARETGELLKRLVKYLPKQELTRPPTLKEPTANYDYIQKVAAQVRAEMGLENKAVIDFSDLIGKFNQLQAVIVPVLWVEQQHHGNALNMFLPDSQTTWVFLNLDSSVVDFKFWMAHELGHSLAPQLTGDGGTLRMVLPKRCCSQKATRRGCVPTCKGYAASAGGLRVSATTPEST